MKAIQTIIHFRHCLLMPPITLTLSLMHCLWLGTKSEVMKFFVPYNTINNDADSTPPTMTGSLRELREHLPTPMKLLLVREIL